ncbi:hypothetical protein, unlikely [Trypanosoma brucei gambiense DAL972]|uniref:Retrotransposon hot spot protein N-terminal domain-containing protein n=1 Tax=Trypanosoma brucei gambiense (strain MHOM/CI/86/DAL972) TaxID=679716 RepID=C9ZL13_TRYB9|nr:hypothetical protein, unlikely [Trypanosoma brucei gambiense DAL972]CBH10022.1 hypothetical protein, unlikely [Trypanosoma brucei gambiense DAL972]|eukprot:XP_011772312.1 hypothetical protein, unlikely [Trypanosoma brucei gambiense DAL972]
MPSKCLMWKDEEVNVVPEIDEALEQKPERTKGLDLLVLTSEMGWPYTGFARGTDSDIFIRREELRVWNAAENGIQLWEARKHRTTLNYNLYSFHLETISILKFDMAIKN